MGTDFTETQLFRSLLDASADGILAFDQECRYTAWNAAMERISGFRRDEVLGRVAFDIFPFLKETGEDRYFHEALAGRSAVAAVRPYTIPETGHKGFFDGYYSPLRNEAGEIVGGVAIIRDITASREAQEALRDSEERYRAFIANSSEGIWRFELERPVPINLPEDDQIELFYRYGYLAECNDAMARMYGYDRAEEITGARLGDLLVRDDPKNVEYLRSFIAYGYRLTDAESVEMDRSGRLRFFSNNLVAVVKDGTTLRAWGTQRDITERKRIEEELRVTEHRFFMFMEKLPGLAWIKDAEGRYVYINEAAAQAFRIPREEVRGKTDEEIFPPETAARFLENDRLALSSDAGLMTVETLEQTDGIHRSIVSKFRIPGPDGAASMIGGIAIDITERLRAEEALRESEEKYRSLLENANDIIYSHDLQGNYLTINRACAEVTGYTREEILGGLNIAQVVVPEHLELAKKMMELKLRDPSPTVYEIDIQTKDGRRLTLELSTRIARNGGQGPIVEGIARDVTDRKRIEREREELLAREQQARREAQAAEWRSNFLAEASRVLSSTLDYEGTLSHVAQLSVPELADWCAVDIREEDGSLKRVAVTHVDPAKVEWAHEIQQRYPPDMDAPRGVPRVLRTGVSEIYSEITDEMLVAAALDEEHLRLMRSIGVSSAMLVPLVAHGRTHGVITFITAESGRRYGAQELTLAEDLARRAAVTVENARLYQEAQRANRLKDEFLATVSHELRTPLTAILGWSALLRSHRFDEDAHKRALGIIERNAKNQKQIIEDLLDVSRIITGKLLLETRPVEIASLIDAAVESLRPAAEAKEVRLEKVLENELPPVAGDPARLQQVIWNLLSNAVKFTPAGGHVQISLGRIASHAAITVSDTGPGISAEFLPFVFDRFRQADSTTTRKHGGLGLGLAIVRHLVELHGGMVKAESAGPEQGSTFTVILPLMPLSQDSVSAERRLSAVTDGTPAFECYEKLDGLKILAVDDEADTCELLKATLTECGAEVTTALSAKEALEQLERFLPDVLISDIGMPHEDGYELIRRIRRLPAESGGAVPAVALTAYARSEDRLRVLREGYQMHISKPVELAELIAVVASLVQRPRTA